VHDRLRVLNRLCRLKSFLAATAREEKNGGVKETDVVFYNGLGLVEVSATPS
jgi:hypothetical protein